MGTSSPVQPPLPLGPVEGDPALVLQLLFNPTSKGVKFTGQGDVTV